MQAAYMPVLDSPLNGTTVYSGADLTVGASSIVNGNIQAITTTTLGADVTVDGNLVAGGNVALGANAIVAGSISSFQDPIDSQQVLLTEVQEYLAAMEAPTANQLAAAMTVDATLESGVYHATSLTTTAGITLTLDGKGQTGSWVFNIDTYIAFGANLTIKLLNVTDDSTVIWNTGTYTTAGADSILKGIFFAGTYITTGVGSTLNGIGDACGGVFATNGVVTLGASNTAVTVGAADCTSIFLPLTPIVDWHFDEAGWNGTGGEVADSSSNALDGTSIGNTTTITAGQVCRAGTFDGSGDYIDVVGLHSYLNTTASLSFWINSDQLGSGSVWSAPGVIGVEERGGGDDIFWGYIDASGRIRIQKGNGSSATSSTVVSDSSWHHVVMTRDSASGAVQVFVDGALEDSKSSATGDVSTIFSSIGRIENSYSSESFSGKLDEVLIFDSVISASDVSTIYANQLAGDNYDGTPRECPVEEPGYFTITHDNSGIHCAAEPVTVTVRDALGAIVTGYAGTIVLDTQTTKGTWSKAVATGFSNATANDGLASYTFTASDNGVAEFFLDYIEGAPSIDIDVYAGPMRDDDSEGEMVFAETGFTITRSVLANPPPDTIDYAMVNQIAGADFDIHVTAFGTTPADPACGVIESYTGTQAIALTTTRINPTTGTQEVTGEGDIDFTDGQAMITVKYNDAGNIAVNVSDGTINGSSADFTVKPDRFLIEVDAAVISTDETGAVFAAAGSNFTVTVTAQGVDGTTVFTTPSYGNEESAESINIAHSLAAPAGGSPGIFTPVNFVKTGAGVFSGDFNWSEVGIIDLTATVGDNDYLGAGNVITTFSNLGRFIPAYFELTAGSITAAHTNASPFTYVGQAVTLVYSLNAASALSPATTTENYQGAFAKLDLNAVSHALDDVGSAPTDADVAYGAVDIATSTSYNGRLTAAGPGATTNWHSGVINVINLPLIINRGSGTEGPRDSINIGVRVEDSDGVKLPLLDLDSSAAGGGAVDTQTLAALPGPLLYGRVFVPPVYGPEITLGASLNMPFFIQYFDGNTFVTHRTDSSTDYSLWTSSCSDADLSDDLLCIEAPVAIPAANAVGGIGDSAFPITIARPGLNNSGSLELTITVDDWLKFDWDNASNGDEYPSSLVTFGRYRGHDRIIYWREAHN
ncbi:MAG: MSHA biogenesis protein MshQ [Paraglaciecola psychrophila]